MKKTGESYCKLLIQGPECVIMCYYMNKQSLFLFDYNCCYPNQFCTGSPLSIKKKNQTSTYKLIAHRKKKFVYFRLYTYALRWRRWKTFQWSLSDSPHCFLLFGLRWVLVRFNCHAVYLSSGWLSTPLPNTTIKIITMTTSLIAWWIIYSRRKITLMIKRDVL